MKWRFLLMSSPYGRDSTDYIYWKKVRPGETPDYRYVRIDGLDFFRMGSPRNVMASIRSRIKRGQWSGRLKAAVVRGPLCDC